MRDISTKHLRSLAPLAFAALLLANGCGSGDASSAMRDGRAAYEAGDYAAARSHFKRLARRAPENTWAAYNLGMACFKLREYNAAAKSFERAATLADAAGTSGNDALEALAVSLRLAGKTDGALLAYDRALEKMRREPRLLAGTAQCHIDKGQNDYGLRYLEEAFTTSEFRDPATLFNMGALLSKPSFSAPGKTEKAAKCLYQFLSLYRNDAAYADETLRAAEMLVDLSRPADEDLRFLVYEKLVAASKAATPRDRFRLAGEALKANPASIEALRAYVKYARALGGVPKVEETEEILALMERVRDR